MKLPVITFFNFYIFTFFFLLSCTANSQTNGSEEDTLVVEGKRMLVSKTYSFHRWL